MVGMGVVRAALEDESVEEVLVFASPRAERSFELPGSPKLRVIEGGAVSGNLLARTAWNLGLSALDAKWRGASVLLCLANGGVRVANLPLALFIQQSLPFSREALAMLSFSARSRFVAVREVMRRSARRAQLVAVQTEVMRVAVTDAFDLAADRVRVFAPPAPEFPAADDEMLRALRDAERPTLLYVGNTMPYKNVDRLLEAFALTRHGTNARLLLVSPEPFATSVAGVHVLRLATRAQLRAAYAVSDAMVFPSLVETVGLPLLEAMSLGLPIVAADRPYAHEICGDAAMYAEPTESSAMAHAMTEMLANSDTRQLKAAAGRRRTAERATASYRDLVSATTALADRAAA